MKIGFLCSEYPALATEHGGIGSAVEALAHHLVERGHEPVVYGAVAPEADERPRDDRGVRVVPVATRGPLDRMIRLHRVLAAELAAGTIDCVEAAECEAHCLPGGTGSVVRLQGSHHFWCHTLGQPRRWRRLALEQWGLRRADGISAVSRFAAEVTRRAAHLGDREMPVIYNPVDVGRFVPRPETVVDGRILFVGSLVAKKGIRELCLALSRVLARHPEAELVAAGRDTRTADGGSFRRHVAGLLDPATRSRVRFLDHLPRDQVAALMASATVCAFPSTMETQGIVFAEAMAVGRPVLVTERGPGPEVLGPKPPGGESPGLLVNPDDPDDIARALDTVLSDPERAAAMGRAGRRRAEEVFAVDVGVDRFLEFYHRHRARR